MRWKITPNGIRMAGKAFTEGHRVSEQERSLENAIINNALSDETPPPDNGLFALVEKKPQEAVSEVNPAEMYPVDVSDSPRQIQGNPPKDKKQNNKHQKRRYSPVGHDIILDVEKRLKNAIMMAEERIIGNDTNSALNSQKNDAACGNECLPSCKNKSELSPKIVFLLSPDSIEAECFKLLLRLLLCSQTANMPRSLIVTSVNPGDVLIVGCDLRKPKINDIFGLNRIKGLNDWLLNGAIVSDACCGTGVEKMYFLPGGCISRDMLQYKAKSEAQQFMDEMVACFKDRTTIFNFTPAKSNGDLSNFTKDADGPLLVIEYGTLNHGKVNELLEVIGRDKILGCLTIKTETGLSRYEARWMHAR